MTGWWAIAAAVVAGVGLGLLAAWVVVAVVAYRIWRRT